MGKLLRRNVWIEVCISFFLLLLFIWFFCHIDVWVIESMPSTVSPAFFPTVVCAMLIAMCALLLIQTLKTLRDMLSNKIDAEQLDLEEGGEEAGRFLALGAYAGILLLYLLALHYVGFLISTPIIMLLVSLLLGLKRWILGLACYIAFTLILNHAAFYLMQIILPSGSLFSQLAGGASC